MEQYVLLELLAKAVAMETHFGQIGVLLKHVVECRAGVQIHVA